MQCALLCETAGFLNNWKSRACLWIEQMASVKQNRPFFGCFLVFFLLGPGSGGSYSVRFRCRHRSEGEQSQHRRETQHPRGRLTMTCIFEGWYESIQSLGKTSLLGLVLSANVNYVITEPAEAITNVTFTVHCRPEKRVFHTVVVLLEQDYTNRRWLPCQM